MLCIPNAYSLLPKCKILLDHTSLIVGTASFMCLSIQSCQPTIHCRHQAYIGLWWTLYTNYFISMHLTLQNLKTFWKFPNKKKNIRNLKIPQEHLQWNTLRLEEKLLSADLLILLHKTHTFTNNAAQIKLLIIYVYVHPCVGCI